MNLRDRLTWLKERFFRHVHSPNAHGYQHELETHNHETGATNLVYFRWLERSASDATTHDLYTDPPHCSGTNVSNWNVATHGPFYLEGAPTTNTEVYGWTPGVDMTLTSAEVNARYGPATSVYFDLLVTNVEAGRSIKLSTDATYEKTTFASVTVTSAEVVGVRMIKGLSTFQMGAGFHVVLRGTINYP